MAHLQTVLGFFENSMEAQQAVQRLLAMGFTRETVELSTQTGLNAATGDGRTTPTEADSSSGRFFMSLFGSRDEVQPELAPFRRGTLVTVQTQSTTEARQVADLLDAAGAGDVAVDERANSGMKAVRNGAAVEVQPG